MPRKVALNPKAAIAYIRVSTDKKRQELGAEAQKASIELFAKQQGIKILGWREDETSGGSELCDRPGLLGALQDLRTHRAGILLVAKRERFTRDHLETAAVELDLKRLGVKRLSADGLANGEDAASVLMGALLDGVAAFERVNIRSRIKAALNVKRGRGERISRIPPYGFAISADGKHLETHAGEQKAIQAARELRAQGMTLRSISERLMSLGMLNRNGQPLSLPALHKLTQLPA